MFPLFLYRHHYYVISCHMVFKSGYFVDLFKGYQPEKFQCSKLSPSRFTEELQKHNDEVIMTSVHIFGT